MEAVRETAGALHKAGVMDATTMREFDALCLPPVKHYMPAQSKGCNCVTGPTRQYLPST